jgi:hypothetical protein
MFLRILVVFFTVFVKMVENKGAEKMKRKILITAIAILLSLSLQANATPVDANIYSDTTIVDGDEYGTVNIYDSLDVPPVQTTVDMTGGSIANCYIYDTAILNYMAGEIVWLVTRENSTVNVHSDYDYGFQLEDSSKVFLHNGDSNFQIAFASGSDNAQLHIYGYDLIYTPGSPGFADGYWETNKDFHIIIRASADVTPTIILHEIPEPCSGLLFATLIFIAKFKQKWGGV